MEIAKIRNGSKYIVTMKHSHNNGIRQSMGKIAFRPHRHIETKTSFGQYEKGEQSANGLNESNNVDNSLTWSQCLVICWWHRSLWTLPRAKLRWNASATRCWHLHDTVLTPLQAEWTVSYPCLLGQCTGFKKRAGYSDRSFRSAPGRSEVRQRLRSAWHLNATVVRWAY